MKCNVRQILFLLLCVFLPALTHADFGASSYSERDKASENADEVAQQRAQLADLRALLSQMQFNTINDKQARLSENQRMAGQISDIQKAFLDYREKADQYWKELDRRVTALERMIHAPSVRQDKEEKEKSGLSLGDNRKATPFDLASYDKALQNLRAGHYKEAISLLHVLLTNQSDQGERQADVRYWLGTSYYLLGDYKNAVSFFKQVVHAWPGYARTPDALLNLANSYYQMGDKDSARLAEKEILKKYPGSVAAQSLLQHLQ